MLGCERARPKAMTPIEAYTMQPESHAAISDSLHGNLNLSPFWSARFKSEKHLQLRNRSFLMVSKYGRREFLTSHVREYRTTAFLRVELKT